MNKQPEMTAATRQRIIDAFWLLYEIYPIEQIRIKEIAGTAGINRSTFYQYFNNIYDIRQQEEDRIIAYILEHKDLAASGTSFQDAISSIMEIYQSNGRYLCILLGGHGDPSFSILLKDRLLHIFEKLHALPDDAMTRTAFHFGIGGLLTAFQYWYLSNPQEPLDKFVSLINALISQGIFHTIAKLASPDHAD
jgi:hypothetical protein